MHWEQVAVDVLGKERVKDKWMARSHGRCFVQQRGQTCKANYQTTVGGHGEKQRLAVLEWGLSPSLQGHKVPLNPN